MKVRITKGSGWYEDLEGVIVSVVSLEEGRYFADREFDYTGGRRFIRECNCEVVSEERGVKMENKHYIADETLGGIKREYVESTKETEVGDYVLITYSGYCEDTIFAEGHFAKVIAEDGFDPGSFIADFNGFGNSFVDDDDNGPFGDARWYIGKGSDSEHVVLEKTDIILHDDERYKLVNRKAAKGELIIVTKGALPYHKEGDIGKAVSTDVRVSIMADFSDLGNAYVRGDGRWWVDKSFGSEYLVLEPVAEVAPEHAEGCLCDKGSSQFLAKSRERTFEDMLVSLSRKVAELEQQVDKVSDETEEQAETLSKIRGAFDW